MHLGSHRCDTSENIIPPRSGTGKWKISGEPTVPGVFETTTGKTKGIVGKNGRNVL